MVRDEPSLAPGRGSPPGSRHRRRSGLFRAFGGIEKGSSYYLHNHLFLAKMGVFVRIVLLEIRPIVTLTRWRASLARGELPNTTMATSIGRTSLVQAGVVVLMVFLATGMARGYGSP